MMRGLRDDDASVRREALEAVGALHFGHAFDPLQRIFRNSPDPVVRRKALESIGRIPSLEAAEMLIDALRQGDPEERNVAQTLLVRHDHQDVDNLLRRAAAAETGAIQEAIQKVLRQRGY